MKEVKIYLSTTRFVMIIVMDVVFVAIASGVFLYFNNKFIVTIPMLVVGILALYRAYNLWKKRPRIVVTDEAVTVDARTPWEVRFVEVESFCTARYKGRQIISIRYKKESDKWMSDEDIEQGRKQRMMSASVGAPYDIMVTGLAMTPSEILNLLTERLQKNNKM